MLIRNPRRTEAGAVLGLVAGLAITLLLVGVALFYFCQTISGDKQVINATDAGALAAAQQIFTVTLTPDQVKQLPQEFTGLGVDNNGNVCPSGKQSDDSPALYNIIAYNNCAAYALEIAFNAAADGSKAALSNANDVVVAANNFAQQLDQNIQNSSNPANAAAKFMARNSISNLPGKIFTGSKKSTTLVADSLKFGYYGNPGNGSNVSIPSTFSSKDQRIADWSQKVLANDGSASIAAAKPLDLNAITGSTGFTQNGKNLVLVLVPFQRNQLTHLTSPNGGKYYAASFPGLSAGSVPHNAIQLNGQSNDSSGSSSNDPSIGTSAGVLNLIASSAAVANNPGAYTANIPASTVNKGSPAYIAIINGGDFQTSLNAAGLTAAALQAKGYSNFDVPSNMNISYDGSKLDIFDVLNFQIFANNAANQGDWMVFGTDSVTGLYDVYVNKGVAGFTDQVMNGQQNFPANNYNNVTDNPGLASNNASVPFVFIADYLAISDKNITNNYHVGPKTLKDCLADFGNWIKYNRSTGSDGLGHDDKLDPLKSLGGSPAKFKTNPNFVIPNTLISATSDFMQLMTLADALKIADICIFHDGKFCFTGNQPSWTDSAVAVMASNYGYNYLPIPLSETKANGLTAIEYAKAQVIGLHAGLGLAESPPIPPSSPGVIYLPGNPDPGDKVLPGALAVSSGLRYFQPYDTDGKRAHYSWPEPDGAPKFETPGTPLQLLKNMNLLVNAGKFKSDDQNYNNILNNMLTVVKQMNKDISIDDLTAALDSAPIDLGQTFYLIYDSTQQKLVMVSALPDDQTYQPADGAKASATYGTTYPISGSAADEMAPDNKTLVDTGRATKSTISYNGDKVVTAPYGDSKLHLSPYNASLLTTTYFMGANGFVGAASGSLKATDTAVFWPSSGGNNNHGELRLLETVGGLFFPSSIN